MSQYEYFATPEEEVEVEEEEVEPEVTEEEEWGEKEAWFFYTIFKIIQIILHLIAFYVAWGLFPTKHYMTRALFALVVSGFPIGFLVTLLALRTLGVLI